jgi:hypothetical protein
MAKHFTSGEQFQKWPYGNPAIADVIMGQFSQKINL